MFAEYVVPIAAIVAAFFVAFAFIKGGLLGLIFALAAIAAVRVGYAFIRWLGWTQ